MSLVKKILKNILPYGLIQNIRKSKSVNWSGDYSTWKEASDLCQGYDDTNIIEKVRDAALKVKKGEVSYERDSVLFDKVQYSWPVVSSLLKVYNKTDMLNVLDFGGGLGSCYYQNRDFLDEFSNITWSVVEQEAFYKIGKAEFQDEQFKFYKTIDECFSSEEVNVVFISSVLQYIDNPYELLDQIKKYAPKYILLDRLSLLNRKNDRITVQTVPAEIYKASYPCRFFGETNIVDHFEDQYELVYDFEAYLLNQVDFGDGDISKDMGMLLRKK